MARGRELSAASRREQLLVRLRQSDGEVHVAELERLFGVSAVTVRADLSALAEQGLVVRTHGGAILAERPRSELAFATRDATHAELKYRIGLAAVDLISNHSAVVLDASTTALAIARALKSREWEGLTVITNGLWTALELVGVAGVTTLLTGGHVRETGYSLVGPLARDHLENVSASVGFFGAAGLTPTRGLTDLNLDEVEIKSALVGACQRVVAVVDHTKLGQVGLAMFAPLKRLGLVITDDQADPSHLSALRRAGVEVQLV
jgi:DeoR/GlpR family transcriptional regulator of sugar metabolism